MTHLLPRICQRVIDLEIRLSCVKLSNTFYLQLVRVNGFPIFNIPSSWSQVQIVACIAVINDFILAMYNKRL
jgi:hypothetical protein